MTLPTEEAARHREVAGRFTALVRATSDWSAPAPVDGWAAVDVVQHLVTWSTGLLGSYDVRLPGWSGRGVSEDWQRHVGAVQTLLDDPASREVVIRSPHFPEMSLTQTIDRLYTTDVFMHTWDLARATGQEPGLDEDHCAELLAGMEPMDEVLRASGQYGARVRVPAEASPEDRLIGFIGRDPAWSSARIDPDRRPA